MLSQDQWPSETRFIPIYEAQTGVSVSPQPTSAASSGILPVIQTIMAGIVPIAGAFIGLQTAKTQASIYKKAGLLPGAAAPQYVQAPAQAGILGGINTSDILLIGGGLALVLILTKKKGKK